MKSLKEYFNSREGKIVSWLLIALVLVIAVITVIAFRIKPQNSTAQKLENQMNNDVNDTQKIDYQGGFVGNVANEISIEENSSGSFERESGEDFDSSEINLQTKVYEANENYLEIMDEKTDSSIKKVNTKYMAGESMALDLTEISSTNIAWSGWKTYNGATINSNGLAITSSGQYAEKFFLVNGEKWKAGFEGLLDSSNTKSSVDVIVEYYDQYFRPITSNTGTNSTVVQYDLSTSSKYCFLKINDGYGINVKYVKIKFAWDTNNSGGPIRITEFNFNSRVSKTTTGIRINVVGTEKTVSSIKYLWSKNSSTITRELLTNTAQNGEVVYPETEEAQGMYYLWTLVTYSDSTEMFSHSEAIRIDNLKMTLSKDTSDWSRQVRVTAKIYNKEDINDGQPESSGIAEKKWTKGNVESDFFRNTANASSIHNIDLNVDYFIANENAVYTVYAKTSGGSEIVKSIEIKNVDTILPNIDIDLSGYIEGTITGDDVGVVVTGYDEHSGIKSIEYSDDNKLNWKKMLPSSSDEYNNLLANGDFSGTERTRYEWDKNLNGTEEIIYWKLYDSDIRESTVGYHPHLDNSKFGSNVLAFINKNSSVRSDLANRELKAVTSVEYKEGQPKLKASTYYTLSFDIYAEDEGTIISGAIYSNGTQAVNTPMSISAKDPEVNHWVRKSFTFKTNSSVDTSTKAKLMLFGNEGAEGTFYIKNVKLEEGDASGWKPNVAEQAKNLKKGYILFNKSMNKNVWFRVTDNSGRTIEESRKLIINKEIPNISNVYINRNDDTTSSNEVTVEVDVSNYASYMYISESNTVPKQSQYIPYEKYSKFTFSKENGNKTLYVWCRNDVGHIGTMKSDSIELKNTCRVKFKCNQTYYLNEKAGYKVEYTMKKVTDSVYPDWQEKDTFTGMELDTLYTVKTRIIDSPGVYRESREFKFKIIYDDKGEIVIQSQ